MKIIIIMGNIRKNGQTLKIVKRFEEQFKRNDNIEFEYIHLREMNLKNCIGCTVCLSRGESYCPLKDDYKSIMDKALNADGIIIATPNYALQVTHLLKNYIDRSAYALHRPRFFGKVVTSIVSQGAYGGNSITKYIKDIGSMAGAISIRGVTITVPENSTYSPNSKWNYKDIERIDKPLHNLHKRFIKTLEKNRYPRPTVFQLISFRFARASHKYRNVDNMDHRYFYEKGWFESEYYYEVRLGLIKSTIGRVIDILAKIYFSKNKKLN